MQWYSAVPTGMDSGNGDVKYSRSNSPHTPWWPSQGGIFKVASQARVILKHCAILFISKILGQPRLTCFGSTGPKALSHDSPPTLLCV